MLLTWSAVGFGFLAAILWLASTLSRVPPDPNSKGFQIIETGHGKEYDVLETAKRQVLWNRYAALVTALAVFCQAASMLVEKAQ